MMRNELRSGRQNTIFATPNPEVNSRRSVFSGFGKVQAETLAKNGGTRLGVGCDARGKNSDGGAVGVGRRTIGKNAKINAATKAGASGTERQAKRLMVAAMKTSKAEWMVVNGCLGWNCRE